MISKLARRLGFEASVPVALVDDWHLPTVKRRPIELAPREGRASCLVDQHGRIQVDGASWTLEFTLAAGARWVAVSENDRVKQTVVAPGVIETTVQTPSGPVVQRIAAGVVDAKPVAVVEIENTAGVAIAVGVVARPLRIDGRGHLGHVEVSSTGMGIDDRSQVRFEAAPAVVAAHAGSQGDLLQNLPAADAGSVHETAKCRSGGAQAAAVWPLPHTATVRVVVELDAATAPNAAVPSTADINRGWEAHLKQGMRVDVDELDIAQQLSNASRSVLTLWPDVQDTPTAILAMSEMGFGRDGGRLFELLERCDDDDAVLRALARWAQLGEQAHQLEDLERILGRLAQAAHAVAGRGGELVGPAWIDDGLVALGGRLHQIEQPDVAERVQSFRSVHQPIVGAADRLGALAKELDKRGVWPDSQMTSASLFVRATRSVVVDDTSTQIRLLPELPTLWRGRTVDVFGVPVTNGTISFGLRWHGPRPALLWEANLAPEVPIEISVPGIDPSFSSRERQGEALLADPGWPAS